jgi:AsmA protein
MKILLWILGILVALVVAAVVAVYVLVDPQALRPRLESALSEASGRAVGIEALELSLTSMAFSAKGITIAEAAGFGDEPFLRADALSLNVALMPLLREQRLHVHTLSLSAPRVRLLQAGNGSWNFSTLGASQTADDTPVEVPPFAIDALRLSDGELAIQRAGKPIRRYSGLTLELDGIALDAAVPFRFAVRPAAGGTLALNGTAGPLDPGDLSLTPVEARVELEGLDLARVLAEIDAADAGLAGVMTFAGDVRIAQGKVASTGGAEVDSLRLIEAGEPSPQPVRFDYRLDYDLNTQRGRLSDSLLRLGDTALALSGTLDNRGEVARLDLTLDGKDLPVDDLQALLPMLAIALPEDSRLSGGTASTRLRVQGKADALTIAGPVALRDSRLVGFSIGERMGQAMAIAGLKAPDDTVLRSADTDLRIDDSGVAMDAIKAEIAEFGRLEGNGRINADESLNFRFVARLAEEAIGENGLGGRFGAALQGALTRGSRDGIALRVGGTAETPQFSVDQASLARLGASAALGAALAGEEGGAGLDTQSATDALKQKAVQSLFKRLGGKDKTEEEEDGG